MTQSGPDASIPMETAQPSSGQPQQQEMPLAVVHGQPVLQIPQDLYIPPDALEVILEAFEGPLDLLLYLIRYHGLHMVVFSEFYVLMFWNLSPVFLVGWDLITTPPGELAAFLSRIHMPTAVILGLLVLFRFFPTMKAELKGVGRSMRNRGLTAPARLLTHPAASCEYVLVPMLLRCLQLADQLSVSAVARGAEAPGKRGSYHERKMDTLDWCQLVLWPVVTVLFLWMGGMRL